MDYNSAKRKPLPFQEHVLQGSGICIKRLAYDTIFLFYRVEKFMSIFCYKNKVFDTNSVFSFDVDTRLDGEDHAWFSNVFVDRADITIFVVFLSDEVSKTDLPVFAVSFFIDVISCLSEGVKFSVSMGKILL